MLTRSAVRELSSSLHPSNPTFAIQQLFDGLISSVLGDHANVIDARSKTLPGVEFEALDGEENYELLLERAVVLVRKLNEYREFQELGEQAASALRTARGNREQLAVVLKAVADSVAEYLPELPEAEIAHRDLSEALAGFQQAHALWSVQAKREFIACTIVLQCVADGAIVDEFLHTVAECLGSTRDETEGLSSTPIPAQTIDAVVVIGEEVNVMPRLNLVFDNFLEGADALASIAAGIEVLCSQLSRVPRYRRCVQPLQRYLEQLPEQIEHFADSDCRQGLVDYLDELRSSIGEESGEVALALTLPTVTLDRLYSDIEQALSIDANSSVPQAAAVAIPVCGEASLVTDFINTFSANLMPKAVEIAEREAEKAGHEFHRLPDAMGFAIGGKIDEQKRIASTETTPAHSDEEAAALGHA